MGGYDILMLAILVAAILFGAFKGFAWQVASLAAVFLSYVVAFNFREPFANMIGKDTLWSGPAAMLIIYIGSALVIWLVFGYIRKIIDKMKLKDFDRQVGAVLGGVHGALLCIVVTLFAVTLASEERRATIVKSNSGYYIAVGIDRLHGFVPAQVHEVLHPYVHQFQEDVENAQPLRNMARQKEQGAEFDGAIETTNESLSPASNNWAAGEFMATPTISDSQETRTEIQRTAERAANIWDRINK